MTGTSRPRFSVRLRLADDVDLAPYEGVPEHLQKPLQDWVRSHFPATAEGGQEIERDICLQLRLPVSVLQDYETVLAGQEGLALLDVADAMLGYEEDDFISHESLAELTWLLNLGGSAYRVNSDGDGLEERVVAGVREAVRTTVAEAAALSVAGSAAEHLSTAWQAAYGLQPDAVRSYSESIKAVEAAAHAVVEPNNAKATLGTMLGVIASSRSKVTTALPAGARSDPTETVESMMRSLWEGQTSRHGSQAGTPSETLESARAAVHLAAALVQWFVSGAVARTP